MDIDDFKYFEDEDAVSKYASENSLSLVIYQKTVYDLTEFLEYHPGGSEIIEDVVGSDITELFHDPSMHSHSKSAAHMMRGYVFGAIGTPIEQRNANGKSNENNNIVNFLDFSMDLKKGMTAQVARMNLHQYHQFIESPITRKDTRLFDSNFLEFFSRTKWYVIPILYIPLTIYLIHCGVNFEYEPHFFNSLVYKNSGISSIQFLVFSFIFGVFIWTISEYMLHRFLFHSESRIPDHWLFIMIHYFLHGVHHFIPQDPERLVFPPPMFVVIYSMIKFVILSLSPTNFGYMIMAGLLFGYICYDLFHYYLHHGILSDGIVLKMKRYHGLHHYSDTEGGFGISNTIWDIVFNTKPRKYSEIQQKANK